MGPYTLLPLDPRCLAGDAKPNPSAFCRGGVAGASALNGGDEPTPAPPTPGLTQSLRLRRCLRPNDSHREDGERGPKSCRDEFLASLIDPHYFLSPSSPFDLLFSSLLSRSPGVDQLSLTADYTNRLRQLRSLWRLVESF